MKSIHPIQLSILQDLLFSTSRKYSEMKPYEMEGSQFTFHLDKLTKDKYIEKSKDGLYTLTTKGKEYANRMDTGASLMKRQAKSTIQMCAVRTRNGKKEYLLYKRLKNPFYGHFGFPTHKFWFGDTILEAAANGLFEEANLTGAVKLLAVRHYKVFYQEQLVEDKIMYVCLFDEPEGKLESKKDGEFFWISKDDIANLKSPSLPEFEETMNIVENSNEIEFFKEIDQYVDSF